MARSVPEVQSELASFGCRPDKRLLEVLANALLPAEMIESAIQLKIGWDYSDTLVVATNYRLFGFSNQSPELQHVYWSDVAHSELVRGYNEEFFLRVSGWGTSGGINVMLRKPKAEAMAAITKFADSIQARVAQTKGLSQDPIAALERLAALHRSGALTDEEFQAAKRKLLGM